MNTINTMEKEDNVQKPNLVVNTSDDFGIPPPPSSPPPNATNANANSSGFTNDMKTFCNKCCLKPRDCKKRYDEDMEEYSNFKMDGSCCKCIHAFEFFLLLIFHLFILATTISILSNWFFTDRLSFRDESLIIKSEKSYNNTWESDCLFTFQAIPDKWTEDYLNILENNTNPDANDDNVESSNVINIDNSALLGFKSESILSQIKLTEILRATNGLETPSTLRTAVSIQLLSQYVKQENTNKSKILNVALNELLHSIYCIPDGSSDKVRMSPSTMLTPENINNQDVRDSINKPYFELFKKIKETNESLLQRNAEYRKRLKVIAHASKDRTMAMDTIIYRWKRKIKLFVFLQWKYLTIDDKDKNENISNLFAEMKRRKKYRETFHAWRSMAQQTKNKNFKHIKMSLDAAEKTEDELRDKIDHMGNEIVKQQEQIEELQQVNFQVVMVVADLICQIERENGKGCEA